MGVSCRGAAQKRHMGSDSREQKLHAVPAILNVNRYSVWAALGGAGAVPVRRIDSGEHQGIRTAP